MTTRDIQDHLQEIYGVEVSADLISTVTDGAINDVKDWQNRPLDEVYPVLYLDATKRCAVKVASSIKALTWPLGSI